MKLNLKEKKVNLKLIIIYVLVIILTITAGGVIYLKSQFDTNRLKKIILPKLENSLNRTIVINNIKLKFLKGLKIQLSGVKIRNQKGFKTEYLAQFDKLNLNLSLMPLLHKKIEIETLELVKPIINLEHNNGETNYKLGSNVKKNNKADNKENSSKFSIDFKEIEIINGMINYRDTTKELDLTVNALDAGIRINQSALPKKIIIERFKGNLGDSPINLQAQITNFSNPYFDVKLSSNLDATDINKILANNTLKLTGKLKTNLVGKNMELTTDWKNMNVTGNIELFNFGLKKQISKNKLNGVINFKDDKITAKEFKIDTANSTIRTNLEIKKWRHMLVAWLNNKQQLPGAIKLDLIAEKLNIDELFTNNVQDDTIQGSSTAKQSKTKSEKGYYPELDLSARINVDELYYQQSKYGKLNGKFIVDNSHLILNKLNIKGDKSQAEIKGEVDYNNLRKTGDYKDLIFKLDVITNLDLRGLEEQLLKLNPSLKVYSLKGKVKTNLVTKFKLENLITNQLDSLNKIDVTGTVQISGEDIKLPKLSKKLKQIKTELLIDNQQLKMKDIFVKLDKSDLRGSILISNWKENLYEDKKFLMQNVMFDLNSQYLATDELINLTLGEENEESKQVKQESTKKEEKNFTIPISGKGRVVVNKLEYKGVIAHNLESNIKITENKLATNGFNLDFAQGKITGKGSLNLKDKTPMYQGKIDVNKVKANKLLSQLTNFKNHLYGDLKLNANFKGSGFKIQSFLDNITLQGDVLVNQGKLVGWEITNNFNNWFNIFDEEKLKFDKLQGKINIKDGKIYLKKFNSNTSKGNIYFTGYSTSTGNLNYKLRYLLSKEESKKLDLKKKELFYAPDTEQVELDFKLDGTISNPKLEWDKSIVNKNVKQKFKEKTEKIEDKLKEKFKNLF